MTPCPKKDKAILSLVAPLDKQKLQSLLGTVNFRATFVPNLAKKTFLMRNLINHWYHRYRSTMFLKGYHRANTSFTDGKPSFTIRHYPLPLIPSVLIDNLFEGPPSGQHTSFTDGKPSFTIRHYPLPLVPSVPIDIVF